jgi:hypothetical protein
MVEERNYEQEASQEGWRPQEEWGGDPDKWVDAKTFVERGENIAGILKSRLSKMENRLERAEEANRKFGEYHKQTIEKERKAAQEHIDYLESQLAQAIETGDGQTFNQINKEINELRNNMPTDDEPFDASGFQHIASEWLANNSWYNTNPKLATYADGAAEKLRAQGFRGRAYFDELTSVVKSAFPDEFSNPNRSRESSVGSDASEEAPSDGKKHTYRNLPADAKKACDEFVGAGFMTREEYVKQYEWDED